MDDRSPLTEAEPPKTKVFEPLAYFKLKSALLEIGVQEAQLREQAVALHQQKLRLFANAGIPLGAYAFEDETYTVNRVEKG